MVCPRCKSVVSETIGKFNLQIVDLQLGEVEVLADASLDLNLLNLKLQEDGFELIFDRESKLVEQIKLLLLDYLSKIEFLNVKLSDFLASKTELNYTYLSKIFSYTQHITIEKYFVNLKIEKVKELISYGELSLSEISYQFVYSSVQALSTQFKKVTGISVTDYKNSLDKNRKSIDSLQ